MDGQNEVSKLWRATGAGAAFLILILLLPNRAAAGAFEISGGFNYSRSQYSSTSFSWTRRWGASMGYHFTERSGIEFSIQDVVDRTMISGYEDTEFHDQIYSVNWIQELLGKAFAIQPYAKIGIGQLNRTATGTYSTGLSPPLVTDSITGVLGAGMRIVLTRTFALRVEGNSYLAGGNIGTWKDNFSLNFGASLYF